MDTLTHVHTIFHTQRANSPIYALLLDTITITSADPSGVIIARLRLGQNHTNSKGGLHGTLTACLVDWVAGMAIIAKGATETGVSTDLHVSYLSSARVGEEIEVVGRVGKMGGTLAFVSVDISKVVPVVSSGGGEGGEGEEGKVLIATGLHTKYVKKRA